LSRGGRPWRPGVLAAGVLAAAFVAAAGGCDTVDEGSPPADFNRCRPSQAYFRDEIWPNFLDMPYGGRKCADAACHSAQAGRELALNPNLPPTMPEPIPFTSAEWIANYTSATNQMNCANVSSSLLLTKPSAQVNHGGQMLIDPNGPEATLIIMWVSQP
jgi:hypothetical protein